MVQDYKMGSDSGERNTFAAPSIALPKGGGAIRGMGEKFAANPVTGTGSTSVPIATSPGRSGFGPELALSYDTGSGNGPFGFGWSLSLPAITRKTDKGLPQYGDADESDVFILSGAEDLVPVLKADGTRFHDDTAAPGYVIHRYRPRIEGLFARIERWTNSATGEIHWRSITRDNVTTVYGKDNDSRIFDPAESEQVHPKRIFSWLICQSYDDKGNAIVYEYQKENSERIFEDAQGQSVARVHERNRTDTSRSANRYLKRIKYGNRMPNRDATTWQATDPARLPSDTWMFEVVFDYEEGHYEEIPQDPDLAEAEQHRFVNAMVSGKQLWAVRPDPFSSYRAGFEVRTYRLCQRVLMFHHFPDPSPREKSCAELVRSTDFTYLHEEDPTHAKNPVYSRLVSVTQSGYKLEDDGRYLKKSLPPLEFEYSDPVVHDAVEEVSAESLENLPAGLDGATYQWSDLHGEGMPGILTEQGGAWFYKRNLSPISEKTVEFGPLECVDVKPNLSLVGEQAQFMDLAGDGQPDLVVMDGPMPGLYEHDEEESWQSFRPFSSRLNRQMQDPNLKLIDLDGDGHADVLITEDNAFIWHASLAEEGFGPARRVRQALDEEIGPRLIFADGTQSIYLADLSGDGLTDLARIRNGEVCYWPNLGYGRFGAKVTMDASPWFDNPDQFDHLRIRLADIDGSGTTDIIYLHRGGVHLYFNQSGNSWGRPEALKVFPHVDDLVSITPVDLCGNSTACLVWSSPLPGDAGRQMRFVDLMGGKKPHLLIKTSNNLGAETVIEYASSTKFYLKDKKAGTPWITKLPFPVHVVERIITYDRISRNCFVTSYSYHHGNFDGEEREFRGFGCVDQWDSEFFSTLEKDGLLDNADNLEKDSHVPPTLTRTWFHTGAFTNRKKLSTQFAREYFGAPERSVLNYEERVKEFEEKELLPDTVLEQGLSPRETREACRALKGSMLRQEIYGLDGTEKEKLPYTVTEQNFTIRCLQSRGNNRHGVFYTHARESLSYHYERNPDDFRIQHALTLEVDAFGNVETSAAIAYGRRKDSADTNLTDEDRKKQRLVHITCTRSTFTRPHQAGEEHSQVSSAIDEKDDHRTPLPAEVRTYEVRKAEQDTTSQIQTILKFQEILDIVVQAGDGSHEVPYEDQDFTKAKAARANNPQEGDKYFQRLIEQVCTLYRSNDLTSLLPLGHVESLALPGETYKLAFTPGLLKQIYKRPLDRVQPPNAPPPVNLLTNHAEVLGGKGPDQGGYVDLNKDDHWWIPSGRLYYHLDANPERPRITAQQELEEAEKHFFLPRKYTDPFGHSSTVEYDQDLLVTKTTDALGNIVQAQYDYRVLQPRRMIDPNNNHTIVVFDALGLVVGTAIQGKSPDGGLPESGDNLDDFAADLTQEERDEFFNHDDPHLAAPGLLNNATTRIIYDLHRFKTTQAENPDNPEQWQPTYAATLARETHVSYLEDGAQSKIQISLSYSDGFGREIQKKIQAEPEKINGVSGPPRWVGSGWTIFNNKGKPVRQYEPFFDNTHQFKFGHRVGVSPVLFYDPAERMIATIHPNHTYEKVVFDPWKQITYDVNDTVAPRNDQTGDPRTDPDIARHVESYFKEQRPDWQTWFTQRIEGQMGAEEKGAAKKSAAHADTPTTAHLDSLGRPFLTVARNRVECLHHKLDGTGEDFETRVILDIEGNQRTVIDALGREVMRYHYYMAGPEANEEEEEADSAPNRIHQTSMEAGERWMLNDVAGTPILTWDSRGHTARIAYDELRRPLHTFVTGADPSDIEKELLVERLVYGEQHPHAQERNMRGQAFLQLDQAGAVANEFYDFKGNLTQSSRRLTRDYKSVVNWQDIESALPSKVLDQNQLGELEAALLLILEEETFVSKTAYDALNRPETIITPHSAGMKANVIRYGYNEANLLEKVDAHLRGAEESTPFVTNIDYDAKGQRTKIEYGNGTSTSYQYDPFTFRLINLKTERPPGQNSLSSRIFANPTIVQDLWYAYDPAGNITHIYDKALRVINSGEKVLPICRYTYDAVYRLIEATGREHIGQTAFDFAPANHNRRDYPFKGRAHPNDGLAMRGYTERYTYDAVGNFESVHHKNNNDDRWKRRYTYTEVSLLETGVMNNRLTKTEVGNNNNFIEKYTYTDAHGNDVHGCMTAMGSMKMVWDFEDQLQSVDLGGGGKAYYVYDAGGERVRKVWQKSSTKIEERIYLGGFEIFRRRNGNSTVTFERETLHVMNDQQRIALVEIRTKDLEGNDDGLGKLMRYQLGNHLGSSCLELDKNSALISYEEYHPYGTSSFQALRSQSETPKRYRYTGKERDEESGLNYHKARYYAPWVGRWMSCDPLGIAEGNNLYKYANGNSIAFTDFSGLKAVIVIFYQGSRTPPQKPQKPERSSGKENHVKYRKELKKYSNEMKKYTESRKHTKYFKSIADKIARSKGTNVVLNEYTQGKNIVDELRKHKPNTVQEVHIIGHGGTDSIYGSDEGVRGLYSQSMNTIITAYHKKQGARTIEDISIEPMKSDVKWILYGCATATREITLDDIDLTSNIAKELAKRLGKTKKDIQVWGRATGGAAGRPKGWIKYRRDESGKIIREPWIRRNNPYVNL